MPLRPDRTIVTIAEARAILAASGSPIARTETVALHHLSGRVLACDLDATMDVPSLCPRGHGRVCRHRG